MRLQSPGQPTSAAAHVPPAEEKQDLLRVMLGMVAEKAPLQSDVPDPSIAVPKKPTPTRVAVPTFVNTMGEGIAATSIEQEPPNDATTQFVSKNRDQHRLSRLGCAAIGRRD